MSAFTHSRSVCAVVGTTREGIYSSTGLIHVTGVINSVTVNITITGVDRAVTIGVGLTGIDDSI